MNPIYDAAHFDPRSSVGALVSRVRIAFHNGLDQELTPFDLTTPQYVVIVLLAHGVAEKSSDICTLLSHDPGAMTRLIDRLEEKKLVRRVPDPADRRALKLELTAQGRALYPRITEVAVDLANRYLHGFSRAEARQLESFLTRILVNAGYPALPDGMPAEKNLKAAAP